LDAKAMAHQIATFNASSKNNFASWP